MTHDEMTDELIALLAYFRDERQLKAKDAQKVAEQYSNDSKMAELITTPVRGNA